MADDNVSVGQIAQQIIAQLSEAVSQLTLKVVQKRENNDPLSDDFPTSVKGVAQAAVTLVNVARELANVEYGEYVRIQTKILEASSEVETSTRDLVGAVKAGVAADGAESRKTSWRMLSMACKNIANNDILLLQLVYGAETARILAAADRAKDALERLRNMANDIDEVRRDPQQFANAAGSAAQQATDLAEFVRAKADDTDQVLLKREMLRAADDLQRQADDVFKFSNEAVRNITPVTLSRVSETADLTRDGVDHSTRPVRETMGPPGPEEHREIVRNMHELRGMIPTMAGLEHADMTDEEKTAVLERALEISRETANLTNDPRVHDIKTKIESLVARMAPIGADGKRRLNKDLLGAADDMARLMAQMCAHGTGSSHRAQGNMTTKALAELDGLLASFDRKMDAGAPLNELLDDVEEVERVCTKPSLNEEPQTLGDIAEVATSAMDGLSINGDPNDPVVVQCRRIVENFAKLAEAASNGSAEELLIAARAISKDVNALCAKLRSEAKEACGDRERDNLLKTATALNDFGIQLKILASVKAAGDEKDLDKDEQLICVTRNLGSMLTGACGNVEVARLKTKTPRADGVSPRPTWSQRK